MYRSQNIINDINLIELYYLLYTIPSIESISYTALWQAAGKKKNTKSPENLALSSLTTRIIFWYRSVLGTGRLIRLHKIL